MVMKILWIREGSLVQWRKQSPWQRNTYIGCYCGLSFCHAVVCRCWDFLDSCVFHAGEYNQEVSTKSHAGSNNFGRVNIIRKATLSFSITGFSFTLCICLPWSGESSSAICGINLKCLIHKLIKHVYFSSCGVVGFNICGEMCTL